jgi:plastocyanin
MLALRLTAAILVTGALIATAHAALAGDLRIVQKDKRFSATKASIKTGDLVTFVNNDEAMHNVYSFTEGFTFDLGGQSPGEETTVRLSKPGVVDVRCAIHPKMKLQITVQPR